MKQIIYILCIVTLFSLLLSACRKEQTESGGENGERIVVNAYIPSSKSTVGDTHIETVRMIVFNRNGEMVSNSIAKEVVITDDKATFTTVMERGVNNVYIICNENAELKAQLTAITAESDVESVTLQAAGMTMPIPMYGKVERAIVTANRDGSNVQVAVDGVISNALTINVERLVAKLNMTIIKSIVDANIDFTVDEIHIKVCHAPKYTPLKEGVIYTRDEWADNYSYQGVGTLTNNGNYVIVADKHTLADDIDRITFPDIYLPEHLLENQEKEADATFLLIDMAYRMNNGNTAPMNTTYIVPIGQAPPTNHNITRNHHYDLYATIKGLGAMGIYAEIVPFDENHHPVEWKPFEGYTIVSERATEYGKNTNIWNDYSQYSGILKIIKDKTVSPALFRYGSITALSEGSSVAEFNASTDVLWRGHLAAATTWNDVNYQSTGSIEHSLASVTLGKGDPCRLVGLTLTEINNDIIDNELWRMPTAQEMEWLNTARNDEVKQEGFYSFFSMITPKNGYRTETGQMTPATSEGRYWSSTDANSFIFRTTDNTKISSTTDAPERAYGVRCIRRTQHDSRFTITGATVDWMGGVDLKSRITENYLVPFWRVTPIDPDAIGITYSVTQGGSKETAVIATVTPLPDPYVGRTFLLDAKGYGLDGKVHSSQIEIRQTTLVHNIDFTMTSPQLPVESGFVRIPQQGATLTFKSAITPNLFAPYVLDDLRWRAVATWYDNQWHTQLGTTVSFSSESTITIPANAWGHIVAVEVSFVWVTTDPTQRPPSQVRNNFRFIQEK